jgi:hypothetical protein
MRKQFFLLFFSLVITTSLSAQIGIATRIGKGASAAKLGYNGFLHYDVSLNEFGNRRIRLALVDFSFFPSKIKPDLESGSISIKLGYKHIFSADQTGFYVEPQAGFCWVASYATIDELPNDVARGLTLALQGGYNLAVGKRENSLDFGLKFESCLPGSRYMVNSLALRVSYSFRLFGFRGRD